MFTDPYSIQTLHHLERRYRATIHPGPILHEAVESILQYIRRSMVRTYTYFYSSLNTYSATPLRIISRPRTILETRHVPTLFTHYQL